MLNYVAEVYRTNYFVFEHTIELLGNPRSFFG